MTLRFRFEHDDKRYEVVGTYGNGVNEGFSVATLMDGAKRVLRASSSDVLSGVKLESFIAVASEAELVRQLRQSYPRMKNFSEF